MKYLYYTLSLLTLVSVSACSDDKSAYSEPLKATTYNAATGLELYFNGQPMPSKTIELTPAGDKATVKVYSTFDLSEISGMGLQGNMPAPGAIPGSPELSLDVKLTPTDGTWQFAGDSDTDYCTFSYAGYATDKSLKLFFDDVKLKSGGVNPAVWQPAAIAKNEDGSYKSLPLYLDWQFDPSADLDFNLTPILEAIATLPIIPVYSNTAYMSISEALSEVLKTIAFNNDGNLIFSYVSSSFGALQLAQTLPNRFQYVITSPNSVKLYIDPMSLFGLILVNTSGGTPADEVDLNDKGLFPVSTSGNKGDTTGDSDTLLAQIRAKIMKSALSFFMPKLAGGLPMMFTIDSSELRIFMDTEMALDMFNGIIMPLITDNDSLKAVEQYLANNPTFAPLLPDLQKALQQLPDAIEKTTKFRVGLALTLYH